jgi:hypothetical protein
MTLAEKDSIRIIVDKSFASKETLENDFDLYSACSNPTSVESYATLLTGGFIG